VVGQKEASSGRLNVRSREDGSQEVMDLEDFAGLVHSRAAGMPFRPLPLPSLLSARPVFYG
jgi:threonyl-tRNA synthetase